MTALSPENPTPKSDALIVDALDTLRTGAVVTAAPPGALTRCVQATHQQLELREEDGGAVKEVGRQPAFVFITVSERRPWGEGGS